MIRTTKVYLDRKSGGVRIYIPREMVSLLKWNDHDSVVLYQKGSTITIAQDPIEEDLFENEVMK